MADSIRIDPQAYSILEKYRKKLKHKGQQGASFSDAVRLMENTIRAKLPTMKEDYDL